MRGLLHQLADRQLLAKLLRFAVTGAVNGLTSGAVILTLILGYGLSAIVATVIGYLAAVPLSFIGHRHLTFRSTGRWTPEFRRFCLTFATGLLASVLIMQASTVWAGFPPVYGVALCIVIVPLITFVILNVWVFRNQAGQGSGPVA
jgi:putative flippase GtrA